MSVNTRWKRNPEKLRHLVNYYSVSEICVLKPKMPFNYLGWNWRVALIYLMVILFAPCVGRYYMRRHDRTMQLYSLVNKVTFNQCQQNWHHLNGFLTFTFDISYFQPMHILLGTNTYKSKATKWSSVYTKGISLSMLSIFPWSLGLVLGLVESI